MITENLENLIKTFGEIDIINYYFDEEKEFLNIYMLINIKNKKIFEKEFKNIFKYYCECNIYKDKDGNNLSCSLYFTPEKFEELNYKNFIEEQEELNKILNTGNSKKRGRL